MHDLFICLLLPHTPQSVSSTSRCTTFGACIGHLAGAAFLSVFILDRVIVPGNRTTAMKGKGRPGRSLKYWPRRPQAAIQTPPSCCLPLRRTPICCRLPAGHRAQAGKTPMEGFLRMTWAHCPVCWTPHRARNCGPPKTSRAETIAGYPSGRLWQRIRQLWQRLCWWVAVWHTHFLARCMCHAGVRGV